MITIKAPLCGPNDYNWKGRLSSSSSLQAASSASFSAPPSAAASLAASKASTSASYADLQLPGVHKLRGISADSIVGSAPRACIL